MELRKRNKLVWGWGINDADYNVVLTDENGKQVMCPIYASWKDVLRRTKSEEFKLKFPTYKEATVTDNWKYFSNFKLWMSSLMWEGMDLDKDILSPGNKHYSEDSCVFVPHEINTLLRLVTTNTTTPVGVAYDKRRYKGKNLINPFFARVNCFGGGYKHLGMTSDPFVAHKAWQWEKSIQIEKAVSWYALQACFRSDVAEALTSRVWKLRLDHSTSKETKYL